MSSVPPVFKVPALPSQSLPQDLAMLVAMGVVDEPKQEVVESREVSPELEEGKGDLGDIDAMLTEGVESEVTSEEMEDGEEKEEGEVKEAEEEKEEVVPEGKEEEEEEEGEQSGEESDDSSSSAASSSSASSTGSAASTTSAAVGRPPTIPNLKAHERHLREVDALENAGSDAGSEPDMNEDMFRSTNELPQPSSAPPLPFQQVPFGQALKELGTIMSAVGKQIVISSKPATKQVGKKEVVVEPEALGEGSVICWSDGRVLGVVHDTFGPLTNPLYTLLLPDNFAQPKVLATSYPSISKQSPPSASSSSLPTTNGVASDTTATASLSNGTLEDAPNGEVLVQSTGAVVEVEGEVAGVNTFKNEFTEDGLKTLVEEDLIRILSPGPSSPPLASTSAVEAQPIASTSTSSPSKETVNLPLSIASTSTIPHTKPDPNLKWIPTTKDPVTHFVEAVGLTASELVGLTVYFPTQMGKFVPTARLKREKWTDASNKFDEEAGEDEMEWSDDEEEMLAKKRRKMARGSSRAASSVRGGSPTPSDTGSTFSNFPKQHSDFAPSAAASSYAGSAYGGDGSDDDEAMLDYDGQTDGGELLVPERTMPAAYEEWGASEGAPVADDGPGEMGGDASMSSRGGGERGGRGRGRGERGRGRGGERGGRGGDRDAGRGGRGGDRESGRGRGADRGERGRGRGDRGRGERGGRGRGGREAFVPPPRPSNGHMDDRPPFTSASLPAPPQMPQGLHYQQNGPSSFPAQQPPLLSTQRTGSNGSQSYPPLPPPSQPAHPPRPMSPTSAAIARATGQYFPGQQMQMAPFNGHPYPSPMGANIPYTQQPSSSSSFQAQQQQQQYQPPPPSHYNPQGPSSSIPPRPVPYNPQMPPPQDGSRVAPPSGPSGPPPPQQQQQQQHSSPGAPQPPPQNQQYQPQPHQPYTQQQPSYQNHQQQPPQAANGHANPMFQHQQQHNPYPQQNGYPSPYGQQQQQHHQNGYASSSQGGGFQPNGYPQQNGFVNPAFGGQGPSSSHSDPVAIEVALQRQKAQHDKEMLDMQRQIALLSRGRRPDGPGNGGGGAPPPAAGQGGGWVSAPGSF